MLQSATAQQNITLDWTALHLLKVGGEGIDARIISNKTLHTIMAACLALSFSLSGLNLYLCCDWITVKNRVDTDRHLNYVRFAVKWFAFARPAFVNSESNIVFCLLDRAKERERERGWNSGALSSWPGSDRLSGALFYIKLKNVLLIKQ